MATEAPELSAVEGPEGAPQGTSPYAQQLERQGSALRSSIAKYGSNSYYYAHAPLPAASEEAKKIEGPGIVTGGPPALLARGPSEPTRPISSKDAAEEAIGGRRVPAATSLRRYSWADSKRTVKVYLSLQNIRPGEEADGPFTAEKVAVQFASDRVALAIERPSGLYLLTIQRTYGGIIPSESAVSISEAKITLTLRKEEEGLTWFNLSKD
ncbi:uncharacterized protein LOC34618330 [Cyclospora cayetanensis]|uniref:Uncharacterized protein n=2 Tax=Cyclospora cayetanensis TaxID=88456 RepID=A0A1D3D987_9EIME|nr:uncharacterized protein LOC34618330 [Cyclospora cayetanensis]OEH80031.1 hypothetical protein cyc_01304 [Cyclospora cayetanensis]